MVIFKLLRRVQNTEIIDIRNIPHPREDVHDVVKGRFEDDLA
jgi:hypothetical protein